MPQQQACAQLLDCIKKKRKKKKKQKKGTSITDAVFLAFFLSLFLN